jgi:DNA polymerase epsilon subunit 1
MGNSQNYLSKILDIREYDVPYHVRVMIDNEIRCSQWYDLLLDGPILKTFTLLKDKLDKADLRVMAFDIETTKSPLKFPDVRFD